MRGAQAAEAEEAYEYFRHILPEVNEFLILEGDLAGNDPPASPEGVEEGGEEREESLLRFAAAQGLSEEELEQLASDAAEWVITQDRALTEEEVMAVREMQGVEMQAEEIPEKTGALVI